MAVSSTPLLFHSFPWRPSFSQLNNNTRNFEFQPLSLNIPMSSSSLLPSRSPFHLVANAKFNRHNNKNHRNFFKFRASSFSSSSGWDTSTNKTVLFASVITVTLAVANRVLYKLALVPMNQYPFFLAQFTTFG